MQRCHSAVPAGSLWFQSSSGQKAGCNRELNRFLFQSSSGQKAGCNRTPASVSPDLFLFQSSSGQKAGCNATTFCQGVGPGLFQSSSGQKAGCNVRYPVDCQVPLCVSILIRPEGRMQPPTCPGDLRPRRSGFNPHPARRPDATRYARAYGPGRHVSILIRPEGRMQLLRREPIHPAVLVSILIRPEGRMQPTSGVSPKSTRLVSILIRPEGRMQPAKVGLSS